MFWKLEESRLVQERSTSSAANAEVLSISSTVPLGKCWVILSCGYIPDVAETQLISFYKVTSSNAPLSLLNPISLNLNPARATFLEQGMEFLLLAGEYLMVRRAGHTAGSIMTCTIQFIEIDQPLYTYEEPLTVQRQKRALGELRTAFSGRGGARASSVVPTVPGGRTGGRSGVPV